MRITPGERGPRAGRCARGQVRERAIGRTSRGKKNLNRLQQQGGATVGGGGTRGRRAARRPRWSEWSPSWRWQEERWARRERRGGCCCCHGGGGGFEWNGMRCEGGKRNEDRPTDTRTDPSRVSVNVKIEKGYCKHRSCKECSGNWKCRLMKKNHNGLTVDFIIMNHCRRRDQ